MSQPERKHPAPGGERHRQKDASRLVDDEAQLGLDGRLQRAILRCDGDDEALAEVLRDSLEVWQRPMARMLLRHQLSAARADAVCKKSFGDEPVPAPPPMLPRQLPGPKAQLAMARARELEGQLHRSLMQMRARPEDMMAQAMAPLRRAEPHVAAAALTELHARPFDERRSAYQVLDQLTRGAAKALLLDDGPDDRPATLDFRSGVARQWASKVVAALESGTTPTAVAGALLRPSTAPAWASLRLALQSQPSRLPALVEQMLDHLETLLKGAASGEVVPAELARRIAVELGPITARIHTGPAAESVAADHGAKALTIGQDVFIGAGQWKPGTAEGDFLIAHELAHVAQAQQQRLHQAAPLAIESGRVVNESEVEADLRARLIVARGTYQTHIAAAPAATGLPTDEAQRAAQLEAQRARLALAAGAEAGAAPAGDAGGAPGGGGADAAPAPSTAKAAAPTAATGSAGAYTSLFAAAPSQHPYDWDKAGDQATTQLKSEEQSAAAKLPSLDAELEGKDANAKAGAAGAGAAATVNVKDSGEAVPAARPTPPLPSLPKDQAAIDRLASKAADKAQLKTEGMRIFDALKTRDPDLKTRPGPDPVVELSGGADPAQTVEAEGQAKQQTHDELVKQRDKILTGPGPAQVQPQKLDEKLKVSAGDLALGPMPTLPAVADMDLMKGWKRHVTGPVKGAFDEIAQPKISATIAPAAAKVTDATSERESARAKTIAEAQQKTAAANAEAQQKQATAVQSARTSIAAEQRGTLDKQKQAVAQLEEKSNTKRTATLSKVDARVAADQAQISQQYERADNDARTRQLEGQVEAQRQHDEAQRQSQNQSWWDRAVDAVTTAIQSVANAIDRVLTAVRDAVGHIIDAVKNAAMAVIEAARSFIVAAIAEFGHWLQDLVNATIGQLFPELAARLNAFIDRAVSAATAAVNAVAGALRHAVAALLDALKAGLNALIDAYRAAVRAAAAFATALVTGDWSVVGRMLLEGILRLCGIDPAQFYALVGQARETLHLILDDPGAFANHVVDAVKGGFRQFGANFLTHLRDGVVQWMFGQFAEQGITMPARWDVAGVFGLVAQVLGLTYPRLRQKAVRLIGERNVERIEWVYEHIMALIRGGWDGLWERIQQDLSGLWDTVVEGVKSWLMQRVVQAALIRLATMWNPAGAIINLIMTAWNVYQWVRENAQRLFGLLQAISQSMSEIAHGNIANAQNFIEGSLARLMPIAISLLANLLGLSGIADRIRDIITRIQSTVDTAIDRLIERVMAMFRGGSGDKDKDKKDAEVPKALAEPSQALVKQPSKELGDEVGKAKGTQVIFQGGGGDPKAVTAALLAKHSNAKFDKSSGLLTLPPLDAGALAAATSLSSLGSLVAAATGVSKVTLKQGSGGASLYGSINPETALGSIGDEKLDQVTVDFSMAGESHQLKLTAKDGHPVVEKASAQFKRITVAIGSAGPRIRQMLSAAQRAGASGAAAVTTYTTCLTDLATLATQAAAADRALEAGLVAGTLSKAQERAYHATLTTLSGQIANIGDTFNLKSLSELRVGTAFTTAEKNAVQAANLAANGKYQCMVCGFRNSSLQFDPSLGTNGMFHVDHIVPMSLGGPGVAVNGRLLDAACNTSAGNTGAVRGQTGMMKWPTLHNL